MSAKYSWRDARRWRKENKDVPLYQLRATVYPNPAKQRWKEGWLWRRERIWGYPLALAGLTVTIVGLIATLYRLF
jgi:hypothetical protein